jgi:peptide/nickel transport system ATP-binding protein
MIVMQSGVAREAGETDEIFANPRDAYTRELLAAVPIVRRR